jgi:hypothetical protein
MRNEEKVTLVPWDWVTGIPVDAPRAEQLAAEITHESLARVIPAASGGAILLTSTTAGDSSLRIVNVGGRKVTNCADLHQAVSEHSHADSIQVDVLKADGQEIALQTNGDALQAMVFLTAIEHPVLQIADQGNPCFTIRDDRVRAKLVARVERSRGILQLVLTCRVMRPSDGPVPREVRAACEGQPLRCLSVSETLSRLYGDLQKPADPGLVDPEGSWSSFAAASSRPDYQIPVAYKRLCDDLESKNFTSANVGLGPAFASGSATVYPGPAILGDARALTGFLLQPQVLSPEHRERTGWIVFAGESLKRGGTVSVEIDFGSGMRTVSFAVPSS